MFCVVSLGNAVCYLRCAHFPLQTAIRRNDAEVLKASTHVLFLVIPRGFCSRQNEVLGMFT